MELTIVRAFVTKPPEQPQVRGSGGSQVGEHVHPSPTHLLTWLPSVSFITAFNKMVNVVFSLTSVSRPSTLIKREDGVTESPTYSWLVGNTVTT